MNISIFYRTLIYFIEPNFPQLYQIASYASWSTYICVCQWGKTPSCPDHFNEDHNLLELRLPSGKLTVCY